MSDQITPDPKAEFEQKRAEAMIWIQNNNPHTANFVLDMLYLNTKDDTLGQVDPHNANHKINTSTDALKSIFEATLPLLNSNLPIDKIIPILNDINNYSSSEGRMDMRVPYELDSQTPVSDNVRHFRVAIVDSFMRAYTKRLNEVRYTPVPGESWHEDFFGSSLDKIATGSGTYIEAILAYAVDDKGDWKLTVDERMEIMKTANLIESIAVKFAKSKDKIITSFYDTCGQFAFAMQKVDPPLLPDQIKADIAENRKRLLAAGASTDFGRTDLNLKPKSIAILQKLRIETQEGRYDQPSGDLGGEQ